MVVSETVTMKEQFGFESINIGLITIIFKIIKLLKLPCKAQDHLDAIHVHPEI